MLIPGGDPQLAVELCWLRLTGRSAGWMWPPIIEARSCQDHKEGRGVDRAITLTASVTPEEGGYVAQCLDLPVVSEGGTVAEALAMLQEAVELYLEEERVPPVAVRLTIADPR
jgi:predicted RNase H-like HicB family nuclease